MASVSPEPNAQVLDGSATQSDDFSEDDSYDEYIPINISSYPKYNYQAQIREWIYACNKLHKSTCRPPPVSKRPPADVPRWLIDTAQYCIVPGITANQYLALSYVWPETRGSVEPTSEVAPKTLLLEDQSIEDFQSPGFLCERDVLQRIPGVIIHAMILTHVLGQRYLWVDRLCIVQDDHGDGGTLSQVAMMDKIYAGAYATIIAAAPEEMYADSTETQWSPFASAKLTEIQKRSIKGRNDYRIISGQPFIDASQAETIQILNSRYTALSRSRWASRGWTYQEQILCKRGIIFTDRGIFWDCQRSLWDGVDLNPGFDLDSFALRADKGSRFTSRCWPDFSFYLDLICPYNGREFSYSQDAMLGMMGIFNAMAPVFPGGFIHGLPTMFLDHALLWQPFGTAERRIDRREDGVVHSSLPSWSWAGWQCFIEPYSQLSGLAYIADKENRARVGSWQTRNLVEWKVNFKGKEPITISEPRRYERHVDMASCESQDSIPAGWRKRKSGFNVEERTCEGPDFSHISDSDAHFQHPIPLVGDGFTQPNIIDANAHLTCTTTGASFTASALLYSRSSSEGIALAEPKISVFEDKTFKLGPKEGKVNPVVVLQQPNGAFAGLLLLAISEAELNETSTFELIAISKGSARARDVRKSLEWRIYEKASIEYCDDNRSRGYNYEPRFISSNGKPALLFDLAMAFDIEAASLDPLGAEFIEACDMIDQKCHGMSANRRQNMRNFAQKPGLGLYTDIFAKELSIKPSSWWHMRKRFLEEQATDPIMKEHGYQAQAWGSHLYGSAASRRWRYVKKMIENGSFFKVWYSREEGQRLGDLDEVICEWYNVLWVERKDGMMYRRACGWVPKHIWELHQMGNLDVKLG